MAELTHYRLCRFVEGLVSFTWVFSFLIILKLPILGMLMFLHTVFRARIAPTPLESHRFSVCQSRVYER
jgi:hypothetical protein